MASATKIANLALSKLGDDDGLVDLAQDNRASRAVTAVFDDMRDAVLRAHRWNFATARTALAAEATAPAWGHAYSYPLPADFVRFADNEDDLDYQLEGGRLVSDAPPPLNIRYIRRVTDTGLFDALFVEALACRIAMQIAMRITGSATIKREVTADYEAAIILAKAVDGGENPPDTYVEDAWMIAREADG